jgi:hypothetical protein
MFSKILGWRCKVLTVLADKSWLKIPEGKQVTTMNNILF